MKKAILLFTIWLTLGFLNAQQHYQFRTDAPQGFSIESSTARGLKLHYSVTEIGIANIDNGEAKGQEIIMKGSFGSFAEGLPNVPYENRYIAVPHGATVHIEVTDNGHETLTDINLLPAADVIENAAVGLPKLRKNMSVFGKDAYFPAENATITQTTQIRGLDVVLLSISPLRYNPVQQTLEIVYDMDIDIRFEGGNGEFGEARYRNPDWDGILRDLVVNSNMLPEAHYYDMLNNALKNREEGCEYLIIAPDDENVLAWADTLKQYRTKQGILTKVVTTTECGGNTIEAIKGYIQNAYEHWSIPPAAVLLFSGIVESIDITGIPAFPLIFYNYNDEGHDYSYISDNLYSDMNGDSIPDLALSRLPTIDLENYKTEIKKLIQYETNPPTNTAYYDQPIITSGYEDNKWFLITSQSVNGFYRNKLGKQPKNYYMLYQYTSNPITFPDTAWSIGYNTSAVVDYFGPNGQNYIAQTPDTLNAWRDMFDYSYLLEALNQGSFLTLYRDHSGADLWCCPWISSEELLYLLDDTFPTFILSIGCHAAEFNFMYMNGHFYYPPIIASLCMKEVGALGGIGASTVTHSHFNDILTWGVLDNFWPNYMPDMGTATQPNFTRPAYALVAGKLFLNQHAFLPNWWQQKITATQNVFHYLGETYLNLYTKVPQPITVEASPFTTDQTHYIFKAEMGSTVCLSRGEEIISVVKATGIHQEFVFPQMPIGERLCLTITKRDRIRFEQIVTVISSDQPYVYVQSFQISDHDNNGQFDAGEIVDLDLVLHNSSQIASGQGSLTLYCESPYVEVLQNTANYQRINPGSILELKNAFRIKINGNIPDQTLLNFEVKFDENENTHQDHFHSTANAPFLIVNPEIQLLTADGQPTTHIGTEGNTSVTFTVSNTGHAVTPYLDATLDIKAPFINIQTPTLTYQNLAPNEELSLTYELSTSPNTLTGAWLQSQFTLRYGEYNNHLDTILQYGGIIEDFETEPLNPYFKWTNIGAHQWEYSTENAHNGQFCFVANADQTSPSVLKATLREPYVEHHSKISFYYKTDENDTLFYYNKISQGLQPFSSKDWHYAEVDYDGEKRNFNWSYTQQNANSLQAKIDDICFPPLHTTIAYAGDDIMACDDTPVMLSNAYAYDCDQLIWTTNGDGLFDSDNIVNPIYFAGSQDLANGNVTLTLSAFGDNEVISSTQIHFVNGISLGDIAGDSVVNRFKQPISHYAINHQPGMNFSWQLEPTEAGLVYDHGNEIDILWNQFDGNAEVTLSATADNNCSLEPSIKHISLVGYSTSEWQPISFELFPNPTDGTVNLSIGETLQGKTIIEVYNLLGELMTQKTISSIPKGEIFSIDLSRLTPGLYIVKLNTEKGNYSKKISLK